MFREQTLNGALEAHVKIVLRELQVAVDVEKWPIDIILTAEGNIKVIATRDLAAGDLHSAPCDEVVEDHGQGHSPACRENPSDIPQGE